MIPDIFRVVAMPQFKKTKRIKAMMKNRSVSGERDRGPIRTLRGRRGEIMSAAARIAARCGVSAGQVLAAFKCAARGSDYPISAKALFIDVGGASCR